MRGLAILVGTGREPRDGPNSGLVVEAWGGGGGRVVMA